MKQESLQRALRALNEFRQEVQETEPSEVDLTAVEGRLRELLNDVGRTCMSEALERADTKAPVIEYQGEQWGNRRETPGTYVSTFGASTVMRSTYQRGGGGKVAVPLDLRLGIVEGRYTPKMARLLTRATAVMTSYEAEGWLQEANIGPVSRSTLDRLPKAVAARYERERQSIERAIREADEVPEGAAVVQVSLDGVMVPQDGEKAKPRGRRSPHAAPPRHEVRYGHPVDPSPAETDGERGRAWHEAFSGTLAFWNEDGEHIKTVYFGRMPEEGHATIAAMLESELHTVLAQRPDLDISFASDGDALQWAQLEALEAALPSREGRRTTKNLDFWHAAERMHAGAVTALGDTPDARVQAETWKAMAKEHADGSARVLKSMRYYRDQAESQAARRALDEQIAYLAKQAAAGRMNYKASRDWGHPIATGPVEAANKTLVNTRLKRAGARYDQHGGQTLLTFRASLLSERFDALWHQLHASYRQPVREAA